MHLLLVDREAVRRTAFHDNRSANADTFYDTFPGGWGWRWGSGYGDATTTAATCTEGTLVVGLFDGKTKALHWRGSANNTLSNSSTKNIRNFDKSLERLFKGFPSQ
jgi:hypothetical protein